MIFPAGLAVGIMGFFGSIEHAQMDVFAINRY
jgi:hypothetical protein